MRRRLAILSMIMTAIVVMAFGMAGAASARQDIQSAIKSATARFHSIEQAEKAGYEPFYVCAEQPGEGTMGQHYVKFPLVADPAIDPLQPEALVYEPQANGKFKLVALEWVQPGPEIANGPSVLGEPMKYVPGPNRYDINPGFYELHYWLYRSNPNGVFADWNPNVSCGGNGDNGG